MAERNEMVVLPVLKAKLRDFRVMSRREILLDLGTAPVAHVLLVRGVDGVGLLSNSDQDSCVWKDLGKPASSAGTVVPTGMR